MVGLGLLVLSCGTGEPERTAPESVAPESGALQLVVVGFGLLTVVVDQVEELVWREARC